MVGSMGQRSEDATLTARPASRDCGSYGSHGGLDAASERAPEAVLATSYSWWQRGSTPRWGFHGLVPLHGVERCVAAPGLEHSAPPAQPPTCSRAHRCCLLPSQVARSSRPSTVTAAARRSEVVGSLLPPLPPPPTSPRSAEASRSRFAFAVREHTCRARACILLLTNPNQPSLTATALRRPHVHTTPAPYAPAYRVPAGV